MLGSRMNLVTTVIGLAMCATFILFVCTRIICRRLRGAESWRMFEVESRIDLEQPEHRISGLEPVVVAAIPTTKFSHDAFTSVEDTQCSICLGEYQEKEVLRIMPRCCHKFHLSCIDIWLRRQSTCPVCRLPIQASSLEAKHVWQATISGVQCVDIPETSSEHSRQWLLPATRISVENVSNSGPLELVSRNPEPTPSDTETRHS